MHWGGGGGEGFGFCEFQQAQLADLLLDKTGGGASRMAKRSRVTPRFLAKWSLLLKCRLEKWFCGGALWGLEIRSYFGGVLHPMPGGRHVCRQTGRTGIRVCPCEFREAVQAGEGTWELSGCRWYLKL